MDIPQDFIDLFPKLSFDVEPGPLYFLWVFDPEDAHVHLENNEDRHPADHVGHADLAKRIVHPERIHGFAYKIRGGWRITDWEHRAIDDPFVLKSVKRALNQERKNYPSHSQAQARAIKNANPN